VRPAKATTSGAAPLQTAKDVVSKVIQELGRVDFLVNNASEQQMSDNLTDITPEELQRTFETNIFSYFYFAQVSKLHCLLGHASSGLAPC